jgi:hypothetical protein
MNDDPMTYINADKNVGGDRSKDASEDNAATDMDDDPMTCVTADKSNVLIDVNDDHTQPNGEENVPKTPE